MKGRACHAWPLVVAFILAVGCESGLARDIPVQIIGTEGGLPSAQVSNVAQGKSGFLWIATDDGLARYNGVDFVTFRHELNNPASLSSNNINEVLIDSDNRVWAATTTGGLNRFDNATGAFIHYRHDPTDDESISSDNVWALAEGDRGYLWIGTFDGGLNRLNPDTGLFRSYHHRADDYSSLSADIITDVVQTTDGVIWVATLGGGINLLGDYSDQTFARFTTQDGLCSDRVWNLLVDANGALWAGTERGLAYRPQDATHFQCLNAARETGLPSNTYVGVLTQDRYNAIWVQIGESKLALIDPNTMELAPITLFHGMEPVQRLGYIKEIQRDSGGVMWLDLERGLARILPTWRNFEAWLGAGPDAMAGAIRPVTGLLAKSAGGLWLARENGVLTYLDLRTGESRAYPADPDNPRQLASNTIEALLRDPAGTLWIATRAGLARFVRETERFERWLFEDISESGAFIVTALLPGPEPETLWVGTSGSGLLLFDARRSQFIEHYHRSDSPYSLSNNIVTAIVKGPGGGLYVCHNAGVDRFDPVTGHFHDVFGAAHDLEFAATDIYFDQRHHAWVAGSAGLLKLSVGAGQLRLLAHITVERGLPHNKILNITPDTAGGIWLATPGALVKLDPESSQMSVYDSASGLPGMGLTGALVSDPPGQMFLGLENGFARFDPTRMRIPTFTPPLAFISSTVMGKDSGDITGLQSLKLQYDDRMFSLRFSALDYAAPENIRYAYRLSGFDETWIQNGTGNQASYTNLPAGDYRFEVRSTNSYGAWQDNTLALAIQMKPAPWYSWWAWVAYGCVLLALLWAALSAYRRKIARENTIIRERDRRHWIEQLHNLTHSLSTSLKAEEILTRFLENLGLVIAFDRAVVYLPGETPVTVSLGYTGEHHQPNETQLKRAHVLVRGSNQCVDLTLENGTQRQCLALPLRRRLDVLGVLLLERQFGFNAEEQTTIAICCEQSGNALEHARLYDEIERHASDARHANRAKSDFLARMSHEIRTPMNGVLGMTELLMDTGLDPTQQSYAQVVQDSGKLLLNLINDILDFSRIEAGKLTLQSQPFDLSDLLAEVITLFAGRQDKSFLALTYCVDPEVPRSLNGDALRVRQILINLIGNAFKFTDEGSIALSVTRERASARETILKFEIADTGIGISDVGRAALFDVFTQTESGASRPGGSGLGLAICRQLVERMGGEIGVDSKPGRGSRFHFTLCLQRAPEPRARDAVGPTALEGEKVLLWHPDKTLRGGAEAMLQSLGARTQTVSQDSELISTVNAAKQPFDVILYPWDAKALRRIAARLDARFNGGRPALIALAPFSAPPAESQWASAGADGIICIPLREPEVVARLLSSRRCDTAPESMVAESRASYAATSRLPVLVVEDSALERQLIRELLQQEGYPLEFMDSGREALSALRRRSYQWVLIDCELPELDGLKTTAALRGLERERKMPQATTVIGLSVHTGDAHQSRCVAAGIDLRVSKPFTRSSLDTVIAYLTSVESPQHTLAPDFEADG